MKKEMHIKLQTGVENENENENEEGMLIFGDMEGNMA
jgi:hypothetical protein